MCRDILKDINYCLNNDGGAPNIETLGIIAISLSVGVGLFIFGKYVAQWYNEKPNPTIDGIKVAGVDDNSFQGWPH